MLAATAWAQGPVPASSPAGAGAAVADGGRPDERSQLLARQQALQAAFDAEAADCRSRFVVTPCLEDVAQRRRLALEPLRERLLQLDEIERRQRAAARRDAVAARVAEREQQAAAAAAAVAEAASAPAARQPMLPRAPAGQRAPSPAAAASQAQAREEAAAQRAADARRRAEAAAARQARVRQRLAEREAAGRPPQALPPVPAASQPTPKAP